MNDEKIRDILKNTSSYNIIIKSSLKEFIRVFHFYLTKQQFIFKPFHNRLIKRLEAYVFENNNKNLCINIPPRFGKSRTVEYFIAWTYAIEPKCNNIYTSYSDDLVLKFSGEIKDIIESDLYVKLFGLKIKSDSRSKAIWKVENGGETRAAPMGGGITGFGAGTVEDNIYGGAVFIDDPLKPTDARSSVMRDNAISFYDETLKSRRNNTKNTPFVLIMQRLHTEDLTGYIKLKEAKDWDFIEIPVLDENTGELAWEEKYDLEACQAMKEANPYTFYGQYQQNPIIEGGNLIKSSCFKRYINPPDRLDSIYIIADTAFSEKKSADNSAFLLCGCLGSSLYLLDGYCKKVGFPELRRDLKSFYLKAQADFRYNTISTVYIENKGSGISLIQQLREDGLPISELTPTVRNEQLKKDQVADKYTRFLEISADIESGYVHIPESSPWLLEFISQCEAFTGGKQDSHDDFPDCLIYALKTRRKNMQPDWSEFKKVFSR